MEVNKLKKDTIERLRKVKREKEFTVFIILDMLEKKGYYLSENTVKRVFSENADPSSFKYQDTIVPLADVLLDFYDDQSGASEVEALKAMIRDTYTFHTYVSCNKSAYIELAGLTLTLFTHTLVAT